MANPAPFAPTSYDSPDWLRAVTTYTASGPTPAPVTPGGITAVNSQVFNTAYTGASRTDQVGPSDGQSHVLLGAWISVCIAFGTITGQALAETTLNMGSGYTLAIADAVVYSGPLPTAGAMPLTTTTLTWPGGVELVTLASGTHQLEIISSIAGYEGGSISGTQVQVRVGIQWT